MAEEYISNQQLDLAYNFIQYTSRNVFLTGKAGTGKTTFLTRLKQKCPKRMVVVAPTGVAAINAGGVTIHSFFQLPFGPNLQGFAHTSSEGRPEFKLRRNKIDIIRTLDLLVIDEISMVRADLLDAVDEVLRRYRASLLPFGGVQLLMIGDLHQLAPVVKDDEWNILRNYYQSMYFFDSKALLKTDYITIELKQVFRQSNTHFIGLLNRIRDNSADASVFDELNMRYKPNFEPDEKDGYIRLTTHNYQSNDINRQMLQKLPHKSVTMTAEITGNFPEQMYPTESGLELKEGAQVMFVKNDTSFDKQYYNGKIGRIINIEDGKIYVYCASDDNTIEVQQCEWQNTGYRIDPQTKEITETVEGTFRQYPLKLAWAITIHKSQGLTFDKVIIDAAQAFSHGQVYVALSRCRTLDGIVLSSRLNMRCMISDQQLSKFNDDVENYVIEQSELDDSRMRYEQELITDLFNCDLLYNEMQHCLRIFRKAGSTVGGNPDAMLAQLISRFNTEVITVANNFRQQVAHIISNGLCTNNQYLQERISKGCDYFALKIDELVDNPFSGIDVLTDNSTIENEANETISKVLKLANEKKYCLEQSKSGFDVQKYLHTRAMAALRLPSPKKTANNKATIGESSNPPLFNMLRAWRKSVADDLNVPIYVIMPQKTLINIADKMPDTISILLKIKGLGKARVQKWGQPIVDIVRKYKTNIGLDVSIETADMFEQPSKTKSTKKKKEKNLEQNEEKISTHKQSLQMFVNGLSVKQIAAQRNLTVSTITRHLCQYIADGTIDPTDIVEPDKVEFIAKHLRNSGNKTLSEIKAELGENYSYEDIKVVQEWLKTVDF